MTEKCVVCGKDKVGSIVVGDGKLFEKVHCCYLHWNEALEIGLERLNKQITEEDILYEIAESEQRINGV